MANSAGIQPITSGAGESHPTPLFFKSVLERVNFQATHQPHADAIISAAGKITYGEMVTAASVVAAALRPVLSGKQQCPIAVCTNDSRHLAIAALAAWKTGCAYLPVSPSSPPERLRHMLTESETPVVLASETAGSGIPAGGWKLVSIEEFIKRSESTLESPSATAPGEPRIAPDYIAYVIYTSGSTGTPKGVAVTHGNLSNLISWFTDAFAVTQNDRATQMRALTFDVSVAELWPALSAGATVHSLDASTYLLPERLRDYLVAEEITICEASTLMVEQLLALEWPTQTKLRYLQTGGESLRSFPPAGLPFQLVNNYGPTECTVVSSSGVVVAPTEANALPSIGRPIAGVTCLFWIWLCGQFRKGNKAKCSLLARAWRPAILAGVI